MTYWKTLFAPFATVWRWLVAIGILAGLFGTIATILRARQSAADHRVEAAKKKVEIDTAVAADHIEHAERVVQFHEAQASRLEGQADDLHGKVLEAKAKAAEIRARLAQ